MNVRPNLLFIFSDQQHWQAVGYRDDSFATPNLNRLAETSAVFGRAYCTTPQCSPSRSSIFTGLYPSKTGVMGNVGPKVRGGSPLKMKTIGARLQEAGYRTGYFGKWHLGDDPVATAGWDEDFGVTSPFDHNDPEVTRRGLGFLKNLSGDQPFALFLSYNNPHDIYHVGDAFRAGTTQPTSPQVLPRSWYEKDRSTAPSVQAGFMEDDQGAFMADRDEGAWKVYREFYRRKTQLFDDAVGEVMAALERSGPAGDTVVIATSDHGDQDTQQRLVFKGPFMYDASLRVPLTIRMPGQTARREIDFPTVNVDLAPTLADLAGFVLPSTDGTSLAPFLTGEGPEPEREYVVGQYYSKQQWVNPIRTIIGHGFKYNRYLDGVEELYNMETDPDEIHNLAADPACSELKARLGSALDAWLTANSDPFDTFQTTDREGNPRPPVAPR